MNSQIITESNNILAFKVLTISTIKILVKWLKFDLLYTSVKIKLNTVLKKMGPLERPFPKHFQILRNNKKLFREALENHHNFNDSESKGKLELTKSVLKNDTLFRFSSLFYGLYALL